jgi:hypothetical protein
VLWLVLEVFVDKYLLFKVEEAPVKVKALWTAVFIFATVIHLLTVL